MAAALRVCSLLAPCPGGAWTPSVHPLVSRRALTTDADFEVWGTYLPGFSISAAGDLDADGSDDILFSHATWRDDTSIVLVFTCRPPSTTTPADAVAWLEPDAHDDASGHPSGVGDVNGDDNLVNAAYAPHILVVQASGAACLRHGEFEPSLAIGKLEGDEVPGVARAHVAGLGAWTLAQSPPWGGLSFRPRYNLRCARPIVDTIPRRQHGLLPRPRPRWAADLPRGRRGR